MPRAKTKPAATSPRARPAQPKPDSTALVLALRRRMNEQRLWPQEVAARLGIRYARFIGMLGNAGVPRLDREQLVAMADFLDTSIVQVLVWAGELQATDFFSEVAVETYLDEEFGRFSRDRTFGVLAPTQEEWSAMTDNLRAKTIGLYLAARRRTIEAAVEFEATAQQLRKIMTFKD